MNIGHAQMMELLQDFPLEKQCDLLKNLLPQLQNCSSICGILQIILSLIQQLLIIIIIAVIFIITIILADQLPTGPSLQSLK